MDVTEAITGALAAMEAGDFARAFDDLRPFRAEIRANPALARATAGALLGLPILPSDSADIIADALASGDTQLPILARHAVDRMLAEIDGGPDATVEAAYTRARSLLPEAGEIAYDFGVWLKQKARFEEALAALLSARASLAEDEAMSWNIAITATGAGDGRTASEAWKKLGFEVERGIDSLPRIAGLADVSVRLGAGGGTEDVWVRPQSPVHGVVLTVPRRDDLPAGYADMILWDAAPIEEVTITGAKKAHRFPLLARLSAGSARTFPFVAHGDLGAFVRDWPDALWVAPSARRLVLEPEMTAAEAIAEIERSRTQHPHVVFEVEIK